MKNSTKHTDINIAIKKYKNAGINNSLNNDGVSSRTLDKTQNYKKATSLQRWECQNEKFIE